METQRLESIRLEHVDFLNFLRGMETRFRFPGFFFRFGLPKLP